MRQAQDNVAAAIGAGRSTENGGTGGGRTEGPAAPRPQTEDLLTHRSGELGGTPDGSPTTIERGEDAEVRRSLEMENSGAAALAGRGYRIQQNPTKAEVAQARLDAGDLGDPGKDPDYLLEGRVFDCYSPVNPDKAAFPEAGERPTGTAPRLVADHKERYGFDVTIVAGRDGYLDLETDDGSWEWEPESYVRAGFRMDKFADARWAVTNMLTVVRRVLDTGQEDATFDFNGDLLLFARRNGELKKHRQDTWWERYSSGNQVIPG